MRTVLPLAAVLVPLLAAAQQAAVVKPLQWKRLDDPGVLAELRVANPEHHRRVTGIVQLVSDADCTTAPKMIPVQFQASDVHCEAGVLLTSYPAKRDVRFRLDDVMYHGHVAIRPKEKPMPAVDVQPPRPAR